MYVDDSVVRATKDIIYEEIQEFAKLPLMDRIRGVPYIHGKLCVLSSMRVISKDEFSSLFDWVTLLLKEE